MHELFTVDDASAIWSTRVPQHGISDRIGWASSNNGVYNVKDGYRYWHDQNSRSTAITQSKGWSRIWRLPLPHKMKKFL